MRISVTANVSFGAQRQHNETRAKFAARRQACRAIARARDMWGGHDSPGVARNIVGLVGPQERRVRCRTAVCESTGSAARRKSPVSSCAPGRFFPRPDKRISARQAGHSLPSTSPMRDDAEFAIAACDSRLVKTLEAKHHEPKGLTRPVSHKRKQILRPAHGAHGFARNRRSPLHVAAYATATFDVEMPDFHESKDYLVSASDWPSVPSAKRRAPNCRTP